MVTVSIAGGIAHNVGQILMAMWMLGTGAILWYLAALWFSGIVAGTVIGLVGAQLVKRIPRQFTDGLC
jgi:heptaprenyl diphosphate synthase